MKRFVFKGSLGDMIDQRSAWAQKKFRKKRTEIQFSVFIENPNWDLKLVFRFDKDNDKQKKKKKKKSYFILKQKSNVPFDPPAGLDLKVTFSFRFKMKENFDTFVLFVFRFHNQIEKRLSNHSPDFQ